MIPRSLYPTEPWPLAKLFRHPCLPLLISDAKDPAMKPRRKRELSALMAVLQHVAKDPAAFAEPLPLSRAFASVPDMPPSYDVGALIEELARLRLFAIEHSDDGATLVPAESARAKPEPAREPQRENLSTTVTGDIKSRVRAEAKLHGITISEMIARSLTERRCRQGSRAHPWRCVPPRLAGSTSVLQQQTKV
jgi:hypothetical protein